jgi:hypothetical protein
MGKERTAGWGARIALVPIGETFDFEIRREDDGDPYVTIRPLEIGNPLRTHGRRKAGQGAAVGLALIRNWDPEMGKKMRQEKNSQSRFAYLYKLPYIYASAVL